MKKYLLLVLLFVTFIPLMTRAETCDLDKINIRSIEKDSAYGTKELTSPTINKKSICLNLSMSDVGDWINYVIEIENKSNEDYIFDENSLGINSDFIDYYIEDDDENNSNIVKANTIKTVYLTIEYSKEVSPELFESGTYNVNKNMIVQLFNEKTIEVPDTLKNPNTGLEPYILIFVIILLISGTLYVLLKKKKYFKFMIFIIGIGCSVIIPMSVYALCKCEFAIESNVTIQQQYSYPCYFDESIEQGTEYTNGQYVYRYKQKAGYSEGRWDNIYLNGWGVRLADLSTNDEINTPVCTSINNIPVVEMSYMFAHAKNVSSIDLSVMNTSKVVGMEGMFFETGYDVSNFQIDVTNLNISRINSTKHMFDSSGYNATTWSIGDLSNWDVSRITDMSSMFERAGNNATTWTIGNLDNWDTSNVTNMSFLLYGTGDEATTWSVGDLSNWDVSRVTNMRNMFTDNGWNAEDWYIGDLSNWDVSNVTNMRGMFSCTGRIAREWNIGDLSNWDTSNVTDMTEMFYYAGIQAQNWHSFGSLNIYATSINSMFHSVSKAKGTLNIYNNPSNYGNVFYKTATDPSAKIIVNYGIETTNIDDIISNKSSNSNIEKGTLLN